MVTITIAPLTKIKIRPFRVFLSLVWPTFCVLLFLGKQVLLAQQISTNPPAGIQDNSRVFDTETRAQLDTELQVFNQQTGVLILIETVPYLDSGISSEERCKQLQGKWLSAQMGIVVCYNRSDTNAPEILFSPALEQRFSAITLTRVKEKSLNAVIGVTDARERLSKRLKSLMAQLLPLCANAGGESQKKIPHEDFILGGALAIFLILVALLGALISKRSLASEQTSCSQIYFPEIEVGQRFGASCGGGVMSTTESHL